MQSIETTDRIKSLTNLGFSLEASKPAGGVDENNQSDWPHISYSIRLLFKGKPVLSTEYKLGVGHVRIKKARPDGIMQPWTERERTLLYTWQSHPHTSFQDKQLQADVAAKLAIQQKVAPQLDDVLRSLLMDGEAFFNAQSFEGWADDFGYDKDSRKAEAIYRECDNTGRKLAAAIPADVLAKARELTQDM